MPLIKFTKADVLRSQNLENEKWYSWQIVKVDGPKPNKAKDGMNYAISFALIDTGTELDGKEIMRIFSDKAISMMIPLAAAASGQKVDEIKDGFDFDTDMLLGKKIDGKHVLDTYEGNIKGVVEVYAPYRSIVGTAQAAGGF